MEAEIEVPKRRGHIPDGLGYLAIVQSKTK